MKPFTPQNIKRLLFQAVILMVLVLSFFVLSHDKLKETSIDNVKVDSSADLKLEKIEQISTRNGVKEWSLKASSAKFYKSENQALLEDVSAEFYLADGETVLLTSRKGILDLSTENLTLTENVVIKYQNYLLSTDKLHYEKKRHIIYSNDEVNVKKGESFIRADSMMTDLNRQTTELKGNIEGQFSGNLAVM